jgi:hypothetical protein
MRTPAPAVSFSSVSMRGTRARRSSRPTSVRCGPARKPSASWAKVGLSAGAAEVGAEAVRNLQLCAHQSSQSRAK